MSREADVYKFSASLVWKLCILPDTFCFLGRPDTVSAWLSDVHWRKEFLSKETTSAYTMNRKLHSF